jgi:hypothetical protein
MTVYRLVLETVLSDMLLILNIVNKKKNIIILVFSFNSSNNDL